MKNGSALHVMSKTSFGHYREELKIHRSGEVEAVRSVQDDEYLMCVERRKLSREFTLGGAQRAGRSGLVIR